MARHCPVKPAPPSAQRKSVSPVHRLPRRTRHLGWLAGGRVLFPGCEAIILVAGSYLSDTDPLRPDYTNSTDQLDGKSVPGCGRHPTPPFRSLGGEIPCLRQRLSVVVTGHGRMFRLMQGRRGFFFDAGVNSPPISEHITCQGRWRGLDLWLERRFNPLFLTEEAQIIVTSSRDQSGSPLAGAFSGGLPG